MSAPIIRFGFRTFSCLKPRFYSPSLRLLHSSSANLGSYDDEFHQAKETLNTLKQDPGNEAKLRIYALFKQASIGPCNIPKPGMMNIVGKAKWDAWNKLGKISQDDAQKQYIDYVSSLASEIGVTTDSAATDTPVQQSTGAEGLSITVENGMRIIRFNRPAKKNAITTQMYDVITDALTDEKDDSVFTVFTGTGDFYCSGNDLSNFEVDPSQMEQLAKDAQGVLERFVGAFIDFPKPLIGVVNGPAVGVSVTVMGMFDAVYASDAATFHTPFSALGQSPEGCSSYVFPRIMGNAKANEMLLFNRKLTAQDAFDRGLVTEVIPHDTFQDVIWPRLQEMAKLPRNSLRISKSLIRDADRDVLHRVNKQECAILKDRWLSDECMNAIMDFFTQKAK